MKTETKKTLFEMSDAEIREGLAKRYCEVNNITEGSKRWAEIMARNINPKTV